MAVDPMKHEMLFFPVNQHSNWTLMVCFPVSTILVYFDSLLNINHSAFGHILALMGVLLTAHGHQFDRKKWLLLAPDDVPHQQNACSCGVYACMNAVTLVQSPQLPIYSSKDITKIRYWMVNFLVNTPNVTKMDKGDAHTEIPVLNYLDVDSADIARKVPSYSLSTGISVFHDVHGLSSSRKLSTKISVDLDEPAEKGENTSLELSSLGEELLGNMCMNMTKPFLYFRISSCVYIFILHVKHS